MKAATKPPSAATTVSGPRERHSFLNLATVIEELHVLFAEWADLHFLNPPLTEFSQEVLKLAVHEWIANLVQHAHFDGRDPEIRLSVSLSETHVECEIEDNSHGFDFRQQLRVQEAHIHGDVPPPERGRGLLMLIACTHNLHYVTTEDGRQVIRFSIAGDEDDQCMNIPF